MSRVTVIGDGGWGTALAIVLQRNGHEVYVWGPFPDYINEIKSKGINERFLPGVKLPDTITWTANREESVRDTEAVVIAVPSQYYNQVIGSFSGMISPSTLLVSVTKGIDRDSGKRMSEMAAELLSHGPVAALSGPSHAEEVARGIPSAVVVACENKDCSSALQQLFTQSAFRVYTTDDVIGVELGGALKNVIAIAAGVSDGIGLGDNSKAALITRGLAEITRFGTALGAHPETFAGLSGMGDLIVTCTSQHSRNRSVGERLGRGETIDEILGSMQQVAEGVWNCETTHRLAEQREIEVPIINEVYAIIRKGKNPRDALTSLMSRDPKPEKG